MDIQVLGAHNCESRTSRFVCLLIDEVLAIDAGGLTSGLSLPAQLKLKAILITHQHYDHVRDVPGIAMNFFLNNKTLSIYSTIAVYDALSTHLLNGNLYPSFLEKPQNNPAIKFTMLEPYESGQIDDYKILAIPVNHSAHTVGYQVVSPDGKSVFYTGDTGPALADCWQHIAPYLLVAEVTAPNRYEEFARESGHLTPSLLKLELISFRELKGYLPQVLLVHMNPGLENEIEAEIAIVAQELKNPITLAHEGMQLHL